MVKHCFHCLELKTRTLSETLQSYHKFKNGLVALKLQSQPDQQARSQADRIHSRLSFTSILSLFQTEPEHTRFYL